MTTYTWAVSSSGDWATASNWSPATVPDDSAAAVLIADAGSYTVTIAAGETQIVNSLTIGNANLGTAAATPTLAVSGTLQFAGTSPSSSLLQGGLVVNSAGVLEGSGELGATSLGGFNFVNNGTLIGNGGTNPLYILTGFTNNGTVLAVNGQVGIEGASFSNVSGTTLSGGSYVVEGPGVVAGTVVTDSQIELGFNYTADLVVDAASVVMSGASELDGYISGGFQPLEQLLQTIAATGSLQLLDGRGYLTSNALTDDDLLNLQGGSLATGGLTIGSGGLFEGFGVVSGGVVAQGGIIANGGALYIPGAVGGAGTLDTDAGSSLILAGGTPASVSNNGIIYDTSGLLDINALTGSGTLVVQNAGTLDLDVATNQSVVFAGSAATLILGTPLVYGGTLAGFGLADSLVLDGIVANAASIVGGNTLMVLEGGSTVDTIALADNYTEASFAVTMAGTSAVVTNTAGAPRRDDLAFTISVSDAAGVSNAEETAIINDLSAAALDWGQYVTGHAPLRIQLNLTAGSEGSELANGGPSDFIATGQTINGEAVVEPSSIYALTTGNYDPGTTADVVINLPATSNDLSALYINPSPFTDPTATGSGYDLLSVFRHELAHGLGFIGERTVSSGALGSSASLFDLDTQLTVNGGNTITAANFIGGNAESAYGAFLGTTATPVPLTLLNDGEAFYHLANASTDPLGHDLMNGVGLSPGTSVDISSVDLAMLQDVGLPVTAGIVCYARGTRIATPHGEVPVEALRAGDAVLTADGTVQPVVWIGRRRIDCQRHPVPEQVYPVCIRADAFGPGLPRRDLVVSPQHAIFFQDVLIPARCLIGGGRVIKFPVASIEYFHVELPQHSLLLAEGLAAESYLDCGDRGFFENGGTPLTLHPQLFAARREGASVAPLKLIGPEVAAARRHLARPAEQRGLDRAAAGGDWAA